MMADDHFPDIVLVREALRTNGVTFEMDVCGDGEAALRYVRDAEALHTSPDLIVLDLNLSCVSGFDVLTRIREKPLFDQTPVAMLTSSLSPALRTQALQLKADAFLSKPTHLEEFLSGVGSALAQLLQSKPAHRG
jgi:chemotaxis family two-component system response regulator Rcp1